MTVEQAIEQTKEIGAVEIIQKYQSLKRFGATYKGVCPFHSEKTPSLSVKADGSMFKCFGCNIGGDGIEYVMKREDVNFMQAVAIIAELFGMIIDKPLESNNDELFAAINFMQSVFIPELKGVHLDYISARVPEYKQVGIGFCSDNAANAIKAKFSKELLAKTGLFNENNNPIIYGRVTFPLRDRYGRIVSFSGRNINNDKPKYLNGASSPIYKKKSFVYYLDVAKDHIKKHNLAIVVEGYTDVLKLHRIGIKNVVSKSGSAISEKQVMELKRFTDTIATISDGDVAGEASIFCDAITCLSSGAKFKSVKLPVGNTKVDPDTFFTDRKQFAEYWKENAKDLRAVVLDQKGDEAFNVY